MGLQMASRAPDLFIPSCGLPELGHQHGLFDYKPLATVFKQRGGVEGRGDAVMLCASLALVDNPNLLTERGALLLDGDGAHHLALGDVICIFAAQLPALLPNCFHWSSESVPSPITHCLRTRS